MYMIRTVYRSVRATYRKVRAIKNHFLNLIDSPVIILIYHRVTDLPADPEMLAVSPDNFRLHMKFLKQQFGIVRFEEEWTNVQKPAVAITFDDGYADNVLEALPILEEIGVPATFFVSTGRIGSGREFWWDRLEGILLQDGDSRPALNCRMVTLTEAGKLKHLSNGGCFTRRLLNVCLGFPLIARRFGWLSLSDGPVWTIRQGISIAA